MAIRTGLRNLWNVFTQEANPFTDLTYGAPGYASSSTSVSPSRSRRTVTNERTIVSSIYNRISIDVSAITFSHIKLDDNGRYIETVDSSFNDCLNIEPNLDQGPRAFRQDLCQTLFDKGVAAIIPVDALVNDMTQETVDIYELQVGVITRWHAKHITVEVYNADKHQRVEVTLPKRMCAIVENPLYTVMNEPNSTLQRLIRKLGLLDAVDEQSSSGKLDIIIQLPFVVKGETRKQQAEERRKNMEAQLMGSKYGVAYADATEKITQLNRPAENNLLKQVEYLTDMLYSQLGTTPEVMNGTADEKAMINYHVRTIEPIVDAIKEAMQRSFIGIPRIKKKERVEYFRDPFKLVPLSQLAEIVDKLTRNEVLSSNEIRQIMGFKPSGDPKADQLLNSNMPQPAPAPPGVPMADIDAMMEEILGGLEGDIDKITKQVSNA